MILFTTLLQDWFKISIAELYHILTVTFTKWNETNPTTLSENYTRVWDPKPCLISLGSTVVILLPIHVEKKNEQLLRWIRIPTQTFNRQHMRPFSLWYTYIFTTKAKYRFLKIFVLSVIRTRGSGGWFYNKCYLKNSYWCQKYGLRKICEG